VTPEKPTPLTDDAFCVGCGYSLRQLASNRCPECGRPFDPSDPATMSIGRPLRAWQRRLLWPTSWAVVAMAVLGAALQFYISRWPGIWPEPASILRDEFRWPGHTPAPETFWTIAFYSAVGCCVLSLLFWTSRRLLLLTIPPAVRRQNRLGGDPRPRNGAIVIATVVSVIFIFFGWRERLAREWIASLPARAPFNTPGFGRVGLDTPDPPVHLTAEQCSDVLFRSLVNLPTPKQRLDVLRMVLDCGGKSALPAISHAVSVEEDESALTWDIRALSLFRDPATEDLLTSRLDDPRPAVRAAGIDALGILRSPSYSVLADGFFWYGPSGLSLALTPPVSVEAVVAPAPTPNQSVYSGSHDLLDDPPITLASSTRAKFEKAMLSGASSEEREAAARAIVAWPPASFHLRVAEWGLWLENDGHLLALSKSIADEIPPFVHRTGNSLADLAVYFRYPTEVTKPVVHLTSDVSMAVDVEVAIRAGRPWFAYPRPDDFEMENEPEEGGASPIAVGDRALPTYRLGPPVPPPPENEVLPNCSEGYPWLLPHHRVYTSHDTFFGGPAVIYSVGVHWQSLIISPQRLFWMKSPAVPGDPRYQWWTGLRDVPSDWVTSRGETERFLYYDGPTNSVVPVRVQMDFSKRRLLFTRNVVARPLGDYHEDLPAHRLAPIAQTAAKGLPTEEGFYVEVNDGVVMGAHASSLESGWHDLPAKLSLRGDEVVARFRQMLTDYGLTAPEAQGLISAWRPWLFKAEGKRFILRISPADYDRQCPMRVRPTPTEVVRLGLVLTEFGTEKAASRP